MSAEFVFESLGVVGFPAVLLGVVLLAIALVGTRVGIDIRCRRCKHQFQRGGTIPAVCSECGADLAPDRALILGRYRPRKRMLAVAVALVVFVPVGLVLAPIIERARAGARAAPDALIDAAMLDEERARLALIERLSGFGGSEGEDVMAMWEVATERFADDPAARATIIKAVVEAASMEGLGAGAAGFPVDGLGMREFGAALASVLTTDPSFAEVIPPQRMDDRFPSGIAEPVLSSPEAVRAFLRGPKLAVRMIVNPTEPAQPARRLRGMTHLIEPMLVAGGFNRFGRILAFGDATASYVRKDGSTVEIEVPPGAMLLTLDSVRGTQIPVGAAVADPEWSGEIRLRATVGTIGSARMARGRAESRPVVADPFEYEWSILVERVNPAEIRSIAVCDPQVASFITERLKTASLQVQGEGEAQTAALEVEVWGSVNSVQTSFEIEVVQNGRTWKAEGSSSPARSPSMPFAARGLDPLAPFRVVVRGAQPAPTDGGGGTQAYAAGTWTAIFDRSARPPNSVEFTPLEGAPKKIPPEATERGRDKGRVIRD